MSVFENHYVQSSPYRARMLRAVMRFIGMKKNTERNMLLNRFKKTPEAVPGKLHRSCNISVEHFYGQKVWTIRRRVERAEGENGAIGAAVNKADPTAVWVSETPHAARESDAVPILLFFMAARFLRV